MLRSGHTPNWLKQLCVLPNVEQRDAVGAITMEGDAKVWTLPLNKLPAHQVSEQTVVLFICFLFVSAVSRHMLVCCTVKKAGVPHHEYIQ